MLKLEVFAAARGDALLLHHGTAAAPLRMLIDGGAAGTWKGALQPRLKELGAGAVLEQPLPLELIMVSHLDDDHINGILALLRNESDLLESHEPRTIRPGGLWINVFEELTGSDPSMGGTAGAASASFGAELGVEGEPESGAVVASIPQGRDVRDLARKLNIPMNRPYVDGLVLAGVEPNRVEFGDIELQVLGPSKKRLEDLRKKWNAYLKAKQAKDAEAINKTAAFVDRSVFNLSSTVVLVRQGKKTILLTGDARGDDILEGLDAAGLLVDGRFHVDVFKVPHHGSARNVTEDFFRAVTARDYVICSDGTDDNPDDEMLQMLKNARTGEAYRLWFSYRKDRLVAFVDAAHAEGEVFKASFRKDNQPSITLKLG